MTYEEWKQEVDRREYIARVVFGYHSQVANESLDSLYNNYPDYTNKLEDELWNIKTL